VNRTWWQCSYAFVREGPKLTSREWTRTEIEALRDRLPDAVRNATEAREWLAKLEALIAAEAGDSREGGERGSE
jgi:hypothetical protein